MPNLTCLGFENVRVLVLQLQIINVVIFRSSV